MVPSFSLPRLDRLFGPGWLVLGFVYWLALVCALEPGNLAGASLPPPLWREIVRLLAAGLLGAAATPAVLALAGVRSRTRPPGLLARAAGVLALAFGLIVVSCVLAAWFLDGKAAPSLAEIRQELSANFVLLVFGLSVFLGLVMVVRDRQGFQPETPSAASRLVFSERGRVLAIDPAEIVWIEGQGNYQAIRTRAATHLVRRTLGALEGELDPVRFVRVHRRVIVAAACVVDVDALSNGDAEARMADGRTFRVARGRRARLRATLTRS